MKILLLGEYSDVHNTLAQGLRKLGHSITVASSGDSWKNYPRDIDLGRKMTFWGTLSFLWRLLKALPKMRGYDAVQLINPVFLELKAERLFAIYRYLRHHNKKMVLGVFGDDYYYPNLHSKHKPLRYSIFYTGNQDRWTDLAKCMYNEWTGTAKEKLNRYIASDCDAIVAGNYEYWLPYYLSSDTSNDGKLIKEKLSCIPFPFKVPERVSTEKHNKLRVFIGMRKQRAKDKGTDIMYQVALDLQKKYPGKVEINVVDGVPYSEYRNMMDGSDIVLDQIFSYCPGMNALLAMSKGILCMTGGEPEHYDIMGETKCRPILNIEPTYDSICRKLEWVILHPEKIDGLKTQSREYVIRNHDYVKVARQYEVLYRSQLNKTGQD